jgi:hypothetical protein
MKFMCLVCLDRDIAASMTEDDWRIIDRDSLGYDDVLREGGHYITSSALEPVKAARTVRVRKGRTQTTDGPFVETKEHVAGFILIEARDRDEALDVASRIPLARIGSVEVRALADVTLK